MQRAGKPQVAQVQLAAAIQKGLSKYLLRPDEEEMLRALKSTLQSETTGS